MAYANKADQAASARRHYDRNKDAMKARAKAWTAKNRVAVRRWVDHYLSTTPCVDCGEDDREVLEFDHRDPSAKHFTIGDSKNRMSLSLPRIQAEIAKCDVRCANCHRRRTRRQWKEKQSFRRLVQG